VKACFTVPPSNLTLAGAPSDPQAPCPRDAQDIYFAFQKVFLRDRTVSIVGMGNKENNMPIIGQFSDELLSTDLIFGTSNGIGSLYKIYDEKKVPVDNGNKGASFATNQKVLDQNKNKIGKESKKGPQEQFSEPGTNRNKQYLDAFPKLPKKYADSANNDAFKDPRAIRRKCKSILYWQLILKRLRVQFVVSGLDLEAIPQKQIVANQKRTGRLSSDKSNKNEGITDAELRWVFRNRNVPTVQTGIQFWKTSTEERYGRPTPCEAPWDMPAYQAAWKEYELSTQRKKLVTAEVGMLGGANPKDELFSEDDVIMGQLGMMG
jgi:hypothetical protein